MDGGIHVCMYVRTYVRMYVCVCVYVCMYKCVCVCVCMCVCMYVSTTGQSLHYLSGRKQYTCCTLSYADYFGRLSQFILDNAETFLIKLFPWCRMEPLSDTDYFSNCRRQFIHQYRESLTPLGHIFGVTILVFPMVDFYKDYPFH